MFLNNNVRWLDNRSRQDVVDSIFSKSHQHFDEFIKNTGDIPFGYAERTLVGQIALAAHDCQCYTLQDYDVAIKERLPKGKKYRYRPDLWLKESGSTSKDYEFEVKGQDYAPIDVAAARVIKLVNRRLSLALKQISQHGWTEGRYRCALIAIKIYCSPRKWIRHGKDSRSYRRAIKELTRVVASIGRSDYKTKPNFYVHYFVPYQTAKDLCWKNEKGQTNPPLLGVLWFGSVKQNK